MWDRLQGNKSPRPTLKDIKADLLAYPDISTMMDVVVIDIPAAYGMLLSRKWSAELGGNLQMDLSYSSIPNAEERMVRIYR